MSQNKNIFPEVYTAIEDVKDKHGHPLYTVLYNIKGDNSIIFEITNPIQQFCCDKDQYEEFVGLFENVIQTLGEDYCLQKQDIFVNEGYNHPYTDETDYMYKAYFDYFKGRGYNRLKTYVTITEQCKRSIFSSFDSKKWDEFLVKADKIADIFKDAGVKAHPLTRQEILDYIHRYAAVSFREGPFSMTNFMASDENLRIGKNVVKNIQLVDIDEVDLPEIMHPFTERNIGGSIITTDYVAFLADIPEAECVIYTQTIIIPNQRRELQRLNGKSKNHGSMPDPSNKIAKKDIDDVLDLLAKDSRLLVYTNFNIMVVSDSERIQTVTSFIENKLFDIGVLPSKKNFNQFELFLSSFPGNGFTYNKNYDRFLTLHDSALCFFYKEHIKQTEDSPLLVYYTDRKGLPVGIDITGKEGKEKMTDNANFFCLGPSGSGKSFHMNSVLEQLFIQNTDIIIIDTGNSYEGIAGHHHWRYITYTKEKPISMNPFKITKREYHEGYSEKKDFLRSLLTLIWLGSDAILTNVQSTMFDNIIDEYYIAYFSPFEKFTEKEREDIKQQMIIESKQDGSFENYKKRIMDLYGVRQDTSIEEVLAEEDGIQRVVTEIDEETARAIDNKRERDERIAEKLNVLKDEGVDGERDNAKHILENMEEQKRLEKEKEKTALMRITPAVIEKGYKKELDKIIDKMEEQRKELTVTSLSFNTFYEFAIQRIPQIAKEKGIPFDINEFKFVLTKFYKGGSLETTLNNDVDSSLFEERGIVFEIDNIKDNPILFPIVTLIIMDTFLQKMRLKPGRKALVIEEAWKAIASPTMADYIKYLYKTVRKFNGIVGVVTQELGDIISSPIVREAIINNSDVKILLDQNKFKERYDEIAAIMGLTPIEQAKIFTINRMDNKEGRPYFKEVYVQRGQNSNVFGVEVPPEWYMAFTTERVEKEALKVYIRHYNDDTQEAITHFVADMKRSGERKYIEFARKVNRQCKVMELWTR